MSHTPLRLRSGASRNLYPAASSRQPTFMWMQHDELRCLGDIAPCPCKDGSCKVLRPDNLIRSNLYKTCSSPRDKWPDHIISHDYLDPSEPDTGLTQNARRLALLPHMQTSPKYAVDRRDMTLVKSPQVNLTTI